VTDQTADLNRQFLTTLANLGIASHRLDQIRDAARLHRQQLIGTSELYAVIEATDPPAGRAPAADRAADELASLAVNAANALHDEKRHYEIACQENARLHAAIDRVRRLHDNLTAETDLASPDDEITRGAAARKIAAALDGWTDPAELRRLAGGAQQDPTQDGEPVCIVAGCGHAETAHGVTGCRDCPRGWRAFHLFSLSAVARPGQPDTAAETPHTGEEA
jgi:hypothetical protein